MHAIQVPPVNDPALARPLWSVLIPTYNCSHYLRNTIHSVLMQDRGIENMEIWVVDDCSTDNPQAIVEELGKGRIGFYRQQQNVGQLDNFSTCLNLSRGKITHLLHGDDFVQYGFYESLEKAFSDDRVGAAFTACNIVDENGALTISSHLLANQAGVIDNFLSVISRGQVIQTPSIVVKREVYESIGAFSRDLKWVEDWEMWIRIACYYNFYYDPRHLASYRLHGSSNTEDKIKTAKFIKDVLNCIRIYTGYLKVPEEEKKEIIHAAKKHYLDFARHETHRRASMQLLLSSFSLTYNFSSFFLVVIHIPKVLVKTAVNRIKALFLKNRVSRTNVKRIT